MTAQRSSRRGYLHSTQGPPPGLTNSCTTARSHWYIPIPSPPFTFSHYPDPFFNLQSRTAARKELLDQHKSPDECERLYEESLWCLYALQDDLLQKGNPFMEEDRETIATCAYTFLPFLLFSSLKRRANDLVTEIGNRDQADKATSCALPCADGDANA